MTVRRVLPYVLAALLGVGCALLAACGGSTEAGIPATDAEDLKSQITDVRQAVESGRCSDVPGQLRQVDDAIDDLPASVDDQLVNNLRDGADRLLGIARDECDAPTETTTTETVTTDTTETPPEPVETTTAPAETTTSETPTTTTPAPQPPPAPEPAPQPEPTPPPAPPPPAGTPGGGTPPEVP